MTSTSAVTASMAVAASVGGIGGGIGGGAVSLPGIGGGSGGGGAGVGAWVSRGLLEPVEAGSAEGTAVIAVQPRADVSIRVQRVVAQRAGWAPRGHHPLGVLGEIPGLGQRHEHPERVRARPPGPRERPPRRRPPRTAPAVRRSPGNPRRPRPVPWCRPGTPRPPAWPT